MEDQSHDDTLPCMTEPFPSFYDTDSSPYSTGSPSENSSTNDRRTVESESPPDLRQAPCRGRASGCFYPQDGQPHCHLRCPPRTCRQCQRVLDEKWVETGGWLEDCVSIPAGEDEERSGRGTPTPLLFKVIAAGAFAALSVGSLCCVWQARTDWGLLQEWAAAWAQL